MGYKLSGYEVLGGVEIDPQMMGVYRANHHPKHSFLMGVQDFNKILKTDIPKELFELDILDGSPPCSSFSTAGSRDKAWGVKKKFREGQSEQVLDDLFFHFIETARILQPKVVIAENVKGLVIGKAKGYVKQISEAFNHAGYEVQLFILNSAFMGVPQRRERTFFIAKRKGLSHLPKIKLEFSGKIITASQAIADLDISNQKITHATAESAVLWNAIQPGESFSKAHERGSRFNEVKLHPDTPANTLAASTPPWHWETPRRLTGKECARIQSFPDDYNFGTSVASYICGMSVPPLMMANVAKQVEIQWLSKL